MTVSRLYRNFFFSLFKITYISIVLFNLKLGLPHLYVLQSANFPHNGVQNRSFCTRPWRWRVRGRGGLPR